jgi:hypothetical protein
MAKRCYRIRLRKSIHPYQPDGLGIPTKRRAAFEGIIEVAGEPGDRWLGHREMAGREESPDTAVVSSQEPVTGKGNAPGNAWGAVRVMRGSPRVVRAVHGKCHRK